MCDAYKFDYNDLYLTLKYAIEYENFIPDERFGLFQFERFIQPSLELRQQIRESRKEAKRLEQEGEPPVIYYVKRSNKRVSRDSIRLKE